MPHSQSEDDVDISESLAKDVVSGEFGDSPTHFTYNEAFHGDKLHQVSLERDEDEDARFIAARLAALNRKTSNLAGKAIKKGGGFQAMGLSSQLLKAIQRKGFVVPTPIQRKAIPLICDGQDVVGMARTGSGKTAAFVIPIIEKLRIHSAKVGARALILSPSRELALQTLKVVKEFTRGTNLRCVLLVGGDSLEEQFGFMTANPDIVIATPGRFLHLKVEMSLNLSSMRYVVFDEADRLFELGFAAQLTEILHALPSSRQTLLFSATLPKSLVEFARAGLQEPHLVRLDAESKVSPDLQSAFFAVKSGEKEGALLHILHDIINMPTGPTEGSKGASTNSRKRKRVAVDPKIKPKPTEHSTIVFAATKHHVEYLASILRISGFAVSHAYGSLDQTARRIQVDEFRTGLTNILVVTDVAARGIDIPVLANVINYDFPPQPKIFVHRVGRTARAGQRGWSYSLVRDVDAPYLLDLQLFLAKRLLLGATAAEKVDYVSDLVIGAFSRDRLEGNMEWVAKLIADDGDIAALRAVAGKAERLYFKTRNSASSESARRAKIVVASTGWTKLHPLFGSDSSHAEQAKIEMLTQISGYRPQETIFEIGAKGKTSYGEAAEVMRRRREKIIPTGSRDEANIGKEQPERDDRCRYSTEDDDGLEVTVTDGGEMIEASNRELETTFAKAVQKGKGRSLSYKDSENFMSYAPKMLNAAEDRGYGVHSGSYNTASQNSNFQEAAKAVTMNLTGDDLKKPFAESINANGMRWDKKHSKYIWRGHDEDGSRGAKMIRGESGQKIAASFQSGRFNRWRKAHKIGHLPRIGEIEKESVAKGVTSRGLAGTRYKHKQEKAPKEADKYRDDYYTQKRRVAEAKEKRVGRFRDGVGKDEIKSVADIRKERNMETLRKAKNARPSKKRKS